VAFAKNTFSLGKIASEKDAKAGKSDAKFFDIHCMPLTAILLAVNMTEIDFFSLDIEGHELDVLRAIDFDKIKITAKPQIISILKFLTRTTFRCFWLSFRTEQSLKRQ
jgi:Methyltransferase FkbM domain